MKRELEYVIQVAEEESISKAAKNLYITPSALSRYIQNIENRYNIPLFNRVGKKFVLTDAGKRYLYWAKKEMEVTEAMEREMRAISGMEAGTINLGVAFSCTDRLIKSVIVPFIEKYPSIEIHVNEDTGDRLSRECANHKLDICFCEVNDMDPSMIYHYLFNEELVLVVKKNSPLLKSAIKKEGFRYPWVPYGVCQDYRFILPFEEQAMFQRINRLVESGLLILKSKMQVKTVRSTMTCISQGLGISICPETTVYSSEYSDRLDMLSIGNEPRSFSWMLFHHKNHFMTKAMQEFITMTTEQYSSIESFQHGT